ncbi:hypothetical protein [Paraburkholderia sp. BR14320]|uniref:hypothetical protein n=1 Tax=unclassified Paraburkholderia TaxID=2615204 RepID=UPI0034CF7936
MRTDHSAAELIPPQPLPAASPASLDDANEDPPQPSVRALTRVAFCFAWLFGLEPFLTASSDEVGDSRFERH